MKGQKSNQFNCVSKEHLHSNSYTILLMEIFLCLFVRGQSNIAIDLVIIGTFFLYRHFHKDCEKIETKSTK